MSASSSRDAQRTLGLRWSFVLMVALAVLPGFIVVLIASVAEQRRQLDAARADLESTNRLVVANQEQFVSGVRHALIALAAAPVLWRPELKSLCSTYMDALRSAFPHFANVGLLDTTGHIVCQAQTTAPASDAGDRSFFRRAVQTGEFAVGEFVIGRATGKRSVGFGLPVTGADGRLSGVVFAALDLERANAQLQAMKLPAGLRIHVADGRGVLLISSLGDMQAVGQPLPEAPLREAIRGNRPGGFEAADEHGEVWLHSVQPIGGVGEEVLFVTVSIRRADAVAASLERLRLELLALTAATLVGAFLAWRYGNHAIAEPARQLVRRMQQRLGQREHERDQLVARLQREQHRLLDAQRLGRLAFWAIDLETRERTWSAHAGEVLGFVPKLGPDALADDLAHVHPLDVAVLRRACDQLLSSEASAVEHRVLRDDGSIGWVHASGECERDAAGRPVRLFGLAQDITERKHAETALRESENRLAAAVDAARLGIFDTDIHRVRTTWLGHHEALWGYAPGEFDGSRAMFEQRIHPDDLPMVQAGVARSIALHRAFAHEYRVVWPDGSVHWIADAGRHVAGAAGEPARISGVAMDITDRKLAQQNALKADRRIGALIERMTSGFVTLDRDWRFIYVNARACKLMGHDADWLLARTYFEIYAPDTPFVDAYRKAMEERLAQHLEARDPGSGHWVESHAYPSDEGISIFFNDITRRKRNEEATNHLVLRLQALREMDEALLDARAPGAIGAIGASRLRALTGAWSVTASLLDEAAATITLMCTDAPRDVPTSRDVLLLSHWYRPEEVERLQRGEICHVTDVDEAHQAGNVPIGLQQAIAAFGTRAYLRLPLQSEGALIGMLSLAKNLPGAFSEQQIDDSRAIADRIAVAFQQAALRDRIALHAQQLEQRVAERTKEVEAVNKELEAFSYSVSHDLRAPLQAIDGFSEALLRRHAATLDGTARHYLGRIRAGTLQMAALIDDLISLARVSRADLRLDHVDLADIARNAVERLRAAAPAREVVVEIPARLPARGDSRLLGVLIVNLLDNAWKFTARTAAPHIDIGATRLANGTTEYFVADNGAGFDMRYADKLFGAFQRLHSSHEFPGTGIGLATVHRIVTRHGGAVSAESAPGVRTVIRFTLTPMDGD